MPLYEYQCLPNHHRFEVRHGMNDEPVTTCPVCGAEVRRVIHPVGIVFKGTGFYATDSRSSKSATKAADSSSTPAPASTEKKSADSKPSASPSTASDSSGSR